MMRIPDGSSRSPWWPTGNRGSALLYVIGALLALGAVGAGIAVMSPSSMQSKLEQEAGARAYYNAQSGRNFIYAIAKSSSYNNVKVNDFMTRMGNGNSIIYKISNNDQFDFTLSFSNITTNSVDYAISSLIGEVSDSENNTQYSYLLYGGGRGSSTVRTYTPGNSNTNDPGGNDNTVGKYQLFTNQTLNVDTSGNIYGNIFGGVIEFNGGSHVYGSVVQSSTTKALDIIGSYVGGTGQKICSNSTVTIDGGVTVVGTVYSRGTVDVTNGTVTGDIYADGTVTIDSNSTVNGNIYANGDVDIKNGKVVGTVYCTGDVTLARGSSVSGDINAQGSVKLKNGSVGGVIHYKGTFSACSYCTYGGVDQSPASFTYVFDGTTDYTLPDHEHHAPNQTPNSLNVAYVAPDYNAQYTFTAKSSLDDYFSFENFTSVGGSKICFDLSNGGYITIFVSGTFNLQGDLYVKTVAGENCFQDSNKVNNLASSKYSYASKVYLDYSGTGAMAFAGNYNWFGTIYATGDINFSSGGTLIGAFYSSGGTVNVTGATKTQYIESDYVKAHW